MPSPEHIIAILADPDDPEDFDVTEAKVQRALADRAARLARLEAMGAFLDPDVLDKFRATGPGWQARINEALRSARV